MKTQSLLSGVAALALLLAAAVPANAVSLEVGGDDGLVSIGDSDADTGVSVDADSDNGGLHVDADVRTELLEGDLDGNGILDILEDKPLLDTGGDSLVTVDAEDNGNALVTLFGAPGGGALGEDLLEGDLIEAEVLEEGADEEVFLRLFGSGDTGTTATVELGDDGEPLAVDVSGAGGMPDAERPKVPPFGGGDATTLMLFGSAEDGGMAADGDRTGIDPTTTASTGEAGGSGGAATMARAAGAAPVPATRVATRPASAAGEAGNCFSPNGTQIAHLLGRGDYQPGDAAAWQQAASIDVVAVDICPEAAARLQTAIATDPDIGLLQSTVAGDARLSAALDPHAAEDVLAIDQTGEELTVYVY